MTKIINRLKKMLALANDVGATEGERDNALRMAYNLLAKHNLSMCDLEEPDQEVREISCIEICGDRFVGALAKSAANLCFCETFYQKQNGKSKLKYSFVGKQSNCVTASNLFYYLVKSIKKEISKRYKDRPSIEKRSFFIGATYAVCDRVEDLISKDVEVGTTGTAIILKDLRDLESEANKNWMNDQGLFTKQVQPRTTKIIKDAYNAGNQFGNSISLNNQINNKKSKTLQIE